MCPRAEPRIPSRRSDSSIRRLAGAASSVGLRRCAPSPSSTSSVPAPVRAAPSTATAAANPRLARRSVPLARIAGVTGLLRAAGATRLRS